MGGAMIFIVSSHTQKEDNTKISEHVHRTGYYFRESIVDQAREIVGETVISKPTILPNTVEPIPESQEEIPRTPERLSSTLALVPTSTRSHVESKGRKFEKARGRRR